MGICSSCLGNRRRDEYDEVRWLGLSLFAAPRETNWKLTDAPHLLQDDEAQHLFDDPNSLHYGSFDQQHMMGQEDPQEVQREIEALQRVVARTSEYVHPSPFPRQSPLPAPRRRDDVLQR